MTKAFDLVKHSILFKKLRESGIPPIFLRLLIFIYMKQYACVKWNNSSSDLFGLTNGVRQGGVISAILYCFYGNQLFNLLRKSGYGCWLNGSYAGIFGYSDDNMLVAPSIFALQKMLDICETFANSHGLKFSTDLDPKKCKTKCTAFKVNKSTSLKDLKLCGNVLPWVNEFKHLGNTITNDRLRTNKDIAIKRAQFVAKAVEIEQEFSYASGRTKFELNRIYNFHFTGSPLWNLTGKAMLSLESSYNHAVKNMFHVPIETHRNLIEAISQHKHLRSILMSRFFAFTQQISKSAKRFPKMLLNLVKSDVRSLTGGNLRHMLRRTEKCSISDLVKRDIQGIRYHPLSDENQWKENLIKELIDINEEMVVVDEFDNEETTELLHFLCVN